jgi:aspartyl-tRNA(Asn)/glutamyl-tRNA(Gln) amidotransferase subunit C
MTKEEIQHLGSLSRLALSDAEAEAFTTQIDAILEYVSKVTEIAGSGALEKVVGPRHNIMRADVVTTVPGSYTETLLNAAPARDGNFVVVKKILDQSE